jgi:hypothetical protein
MLFYSTLALVAIGCAWWLVRDFALALAFPRRLARRASVPAWMRRDAGLHRLPDVPPLVGPVRLPSFAAREACAARARAPRRVQRPRRAKARILGHAV